MQPRRLMVMFLVLALVMATVPGLQAAVVGRLILVEGKVDLSRQGKLPAVPAKVQDGVEPGDVLRTKSNSRAQVRFVDDTLLAIAPASRVAIAEYLYDAPRGLRRVALRVFQGLVYCVVGRLLKIEEPEFLLKTHTANLGVRGTRWFTLLGPNFTDVFTESGAIGLSSSFPEVAGEVVLRDMEFSRVAMKLPPTLPRKFTLEDLRLLRSWLISGIPEGYGALAPLSPLWRALGPRLFQEGYPGSPDFPEGLFVPPTSPRPAPTPRPSAPAPPPSAPSPSPGPSMGPTGPSFGSS
jgi:hypothetical protein